MGGGDRVHCGCWMLARVQGAVCSKPDFCIQSKDRWEVQKVSATRKHTEKVLIGPCVLPCGRPT